MDELRTKFGKEFAYLETGVEYAAWVARFGSFADRNPHLGKMVRCPHCRVRHRQAIQCCNSQYATTMRQFGEEVPLDETVEWAIHFQRTKGKEVMTERSNSLFSRQMKRELMRRRSSPRGEGKLKRKQVRGITLTMEQSIRQIEDVRYYSPRSFVVVCARLMHIPTPSFDAIPTFAEKFWIWLGKQDRKRRRKARKTRQGA